MGKQWVRTVGFMMVALWVTGVAHAGDSAVKVFVSVLPQKLFVERIGGERVEVSVLVSPGESPATYRPKPSKVAKLAASDLYFRIGVPFENHLLPKVESFAKGLTIVDTRKGVALRTMTEPHHHDDHSGPHEAHDDHHGEMHHESEHDDHHGEVAHHEEGHHHEGHHREEAHHAEDGHDMHGEERHDHEGTDPHIWMDPMRVKIQAKTMRDALVAQDPEGKGVYMKGYAAFAKELEALDAELSKVLAPLKGSALYVYHPAFGYFADAYGLVQKAVEVEGKRPKGRLLAQFIKQARGDGAKVIFVQPQFDRHTAQKIANAIGGTVIALDPLAPEYVKNLKMMAESVRENISSQKIID